MPVKQQVNDITEVLRNLSGQIESMQKTIDSQYVTICQISRTSQAQLKRIRSLEQMLNRCLRRKKRRTKNSADVCPSMKNLPKTPATVVRLHQRNP